MKSGNKTSSVQGELASVEAGGAKQPGNVVGLWRRAVASRTFGILTALIALMVLISLVSSTFTNIGNLMDITRQMTLLGLLTIGLTLVLISGQVDLSMGSVFGLSGVVAALILVSGGGLILAFGAALLVGVVAGLVNGILSAYLGLPSFIVTLGTLQVMAGIALLLTDGAPIGLFRVEVPGLEVFYYASQARVFGVPLQFLYLIGIAIIFGIIINRTTFGLRAYASGGSGRAARLSGVKVAQVQTTAFVVSGVLSAIAGLLGLGFIQSVHANAGQDMVFPVFAAAVLGGASLFGGEGRISGALVGAALLSVLNNGLIHLDVSAFTQILINGLVVIIAVGVNRFVAIRRGAA